MAKVMTIQGADPIAVPASSPWNWRHIVGVIGGTLAVAGGTTWAIMGHTRKHQWWVYAGIGTAVAGAGAICVSVWMARVRERALLGGRQADTHLQPPKPQMLSPGARVQLTDGSTATIRGVDIGIDGSRTYQADVRYIDGEVIQEDVVAERIKGAF